ncbi:MAG: hypothetical protein ACI8ZO_001674 [Flavobacteriales bacterium]|jgi:hypothetical protein
MKKLIGRKEYISFPDFGLQRVNAKIDTGAYTSSLHCSSVKEKMKDGVLKLRVNFHDSEDALISVFFDDFEKTKVKSSTGVSQERYLVNLRVKLGTKIYKTPITLANRSEMKCPVLIGRKLLHKRFIVDVSQQFIL